MICLDPTDMRYLVLDKSFLQGCRRDELASIASNSRFVVTAEQYVEVCTTAYLRQPLLRKLHGLSVHIDILDHIGTLFKYEIDNQRPCWPITEHFMQGVFNPNFSFRFTDEQNKAIEDEKAHVESGAANEFPLIVKEIAMKNKGLDKEHISRAEVVRQVYGRLKVQASRLPPAELLDERWAIYRKVQVDLLATFDYLRSYNGKGFSIGQQRRAHDQMDFRTCIVATLVGGLATRDGKLREYFQTLRPTGYLMQ